MSKAKVAQQLAYAKLVIDHPAAKDVQDRVDKSILARFRRGSPEERDILNAMLDNDSILLSTLKTIIAENQDTKN